MVEIISIVILILYALGLLVFVALLILDRFRSLKEMKAVLLCTFCWPFALLDLLVDTCRSLPEEEEEEEESKIGFQHNE